MSEPVLLPFFFRLCQWSRSHRHRWSTCTTCRHPFKYHGEMVGRECFSCHRLSFQLEPTR